MQYRNGRQGMGLCLRPTSVKLYTSMHPNPQSRVQRPPAIKIGNTFLLVEESTKFLRQWWDSRLSFKKHISVLKTQCREALNLIWVVAHLKWGGDKDTLLILYWAIVRSKLDYSWIVCATASNTNLRQLDCQLKLSMHYYLKTCACVDMPSMTQPCQMGEEAWPGPQPLLLVLR